MKRRWAHSRHHPESVSHIWTQVRCIGKQDEQVQQLMLCSQGVAVAVSDQQAGQGTGY
jgi:hypothetical protein